MPWDRPRIHIVQVDSKTAAVGVLGSLHLGFSALLISSLMLDPPGGFAVSMALVLTLAVIGAVALLFVARSRVKGSAVSARYGIRLTQVFVCLAVASVLVSWPFVPGLAISSVVYLLLSLMTLALASRSARELRNRS